MAEEVCVLPASFSEQRLWFLDRLEPDSRAYKLAVASRLRGRLDVAAMEHALNELIARHETLRTTFSMIDGAPQRVIRRPRPMPLRVTDLGESERAQEHAQALIRAEAERGFDLESGPLLRAGLLRLGEDEHIFILTLHHIIVDGWSMGVLNRELSALYSGCLEGRSADLPALPIQYADYASWQQQWIEDGGLDHQLKYWMHQLAGAPLLLELPTDRPRPVRQSFRGAIVRNVLPAALLERLRALGEREGTTLFMALLAAFSVLLSRCCGQEDLVVASPVANRDRSELEGLIGFFVNTLALRVNLEGEPSFRELLGRVRETAVSAYSNQDLPFEKLVEELNPPRQLSYSPVAQVLFSLETPVGESSLELEGLTQEPIGGGRLTSKFDLSAYAVESSDGLRLSLRYCPDLFEEATAARMLDRLGILLEAAVADPDERIGRLPMLTEEERDRLLVEWNSTQVAYPPATLHALVEAQVRRSPEGVAVSFAGEQLTYAELDARANRLARHLRAAGVRPDSLVAVSLERSPELIVSVLGILKAGGAYVPLDPELPVDRLAFMLDDSGADVLVSDEQVLPLLPPHAGRTIRIDSDWPEIALESPEVLDVEIDPDHLAYVIYTSGSTGRPKGVPNTHAGIVNRVLSMQDTYALDRSDRLLQKTPTSFDVSVREIFWPLVHGARIIVAAPREQGNPSYLADLVDREQVTTLHFIPTMLRLFLDHVAPGRCRSLRCVLSGGEALPADLARAFLARFDCELHNVYGPTEAAVSVTAWRCDPSFESAAIPIGRPVANTQIYVVDPRLEPVPVGVWGEILIGGTQLARGYHQRPELTAERFIPNPFGPGRLYRTGDIGRWNNDGAVEFGGRLDDQIKLRGSRIELGEIEAVLQEHEAVAKSAVVAFESPSGEHELAAYIVPRAARSGTEDQLTDLLSFLRTKLPAYMVPGLVTWLDELPLLPNGKLDRSALPSPDRRLAAAEYVPPRSEFERALAEIWHEVLQIDRVGVYDDFFALGGHSLLAIKLISRVQATLQVDVPLRAIFEAPTLEAFAAVVERAFDTEPAAPVLPPLRAVPREPRRLGDQSGGDVFVLPASYAERRLWFLDRFEPHSAAYTVPLALRLRGALDVDALRQALDALVARHESLRTVFTLIDGMPHRVVRPAQCVSLPVTDLSRHENAEERARAIVREDSARPFDLEVGPLLRAGLLRLGDEEHIFLLTLHHIVIDAWSVGVLKRELSELYRASIENRPANLPDLSIQYGDFAAWQEEWTTSGALDDELDYWRAQLAGAPALLELPTDHARPRKQSFRGATVGAVLPTPLTERIKALGEQERATMFMTLLAGFGVLLSRYSGQEDLVVASPVANRDRIELEGVIGMFVNTLPLRMNLEGEPSFRQLLARVREVSLGAFANQHLQFERLVEELNPKRHLDHAPIAQVLFTLADAQGEGSLELPGLEAAPEPRGRQTAKFDLALFAVERPDGLHLSLEYCTDLFEEATALRMLEHYRVLLEALVVEPGQHVNELRLLGDTEERLLLGEWASAPRSYPADRVRRVHELFATQARQTPDAVAVECAGEELSYAGLEERANQLARYLRERGVKRGSVVAVCAERSIEQMVAVLAVLKAGAAYAPIDPSYPAERVEFMLGDTGSPVLLTQQPLIASLPSHGARTVCLDTDWDEIARQDSRPLDEVATSDDLAYVIYTSGSTGRPKGVAMEHRPLANLVAWQLECWSEQPPARTLQFAPLSFDVAFQELFSTWCSGGTLVLVDDKDRRDSGALLEYLREQRVERLFLPFVALHNLCEAAGHLGMSLPALREVITAGEQLKVTDPVRGFFAGHPDCTLVNHYGPTESHVVTTYTLTGDPKRWPALPPIGRPIANAKVYLLDRHRQPVPVGVPGELCIGGVSLARGYLGRPELTSERFVADPFSEEAEGCLYRTGDLARWRPDGEIEYLGRADHQVKIRGFRVEPGEIEAVLRQHPTVREALVVAREDAGGRRLVAYLVSDGTAATPVELREFLAHSLPEYMIPSAFVPLDAFPINPNGKIDRHALPEPAERPELEQLYVAPRTELERALAEIWQQVLSVDRVGMNDDFFELGGHSLMAVRLFADIERKLGARLPLSALFETTTIAGLAEAIELELREETVWPSVVRLRSGDGQQPFFLIAWAGGEVLPYRDLTENLDVPVFGLRPPGADRRERPLASVEELAEYFVGEIRRVQPHGPYRLGGFCFSGLVAYEMARQLQGQGETISTLALMDTYPYRPIPRRGIVQAGRVHVKALRHADRLDRREWLGERLAGLRGRAHHALYFSLGPTLFERLAARHLERLIPRRPWNLVLIASNLARRRYVPTPLDARVTFFRAQRAADSRPTPWDGLAMRGVELRPIVAPDITHESLMREPLVKLLAEQLMRELEGGAHDEGRGQHVAGGI
jgi:amino acid adenylation domain-containing protein